MTCPPFSIISFDVAQFRAMYPAFANMTTFPDAVLQMYWDQATSYVSNVNYGWLFGAQSANGNAVNRVLALNLMTAHITQLFVLIGVGQTPGIVTGATVDKVNVTLEAPPIKDGWQYWLAQTPYGQQLWALLTAASVGGWYVGGSNAGRAGMRDSGINRVW